MTTVDTMTPHLADETLAAFADGRLHGGERDEVITHLAACDDCRAIFDEVGDVQQEGVIETEHTHPTVVRGNFGRWAGWAGLAAAAVVAVVMLTPAGDWVNSKRTGGVSELAEATEMLSKRRIESKIAGLPYKPYAGRNRGGESATNGTGYDNSVNNNDATFQPYVEAVADEVSSRPADSARELRGKALGHLIRREYAPAIEAINEAIEAGGDQALLLADLSGIYNEAGSTDADFLQALATAEKSWAIKKTPEAAWNRALALKHLYRGAEARAAWQEYLKLDPDSAWAKEVREKHLSSEM